MPLTPDPFVRPPPFALSFLSRKRKRSQKPYEAADEEERVALKRQSQLSRFPPTMRPAADTSKAGEEQRRGQPELVVSRREIPGDSEEDRPMECKLVDSFVGIKADQRKRGAQSE